LSEATDKNVQKFKTRSVFLIKQTKLTMVYAANIFDGIASMEKNAVAGQRNVKLIVALFDVTFEIINFSSR
jgi:hypothetical protein